MKETTAVMQKCEISTYEDVGSFPELNVNIKVVFTDLKNQIQNIDMATLKQRVLELVVLECVKTGEVEVRR